MIERTFAAKTIDIRDNEDGTKSLHIRTQDDLRFEFKCGENQAAFVAGQFECEVKEP